ncbi:fragment of NADH-ubiquinone oxidoreductase chain G [Burkholderiales bacterium]|nr:fragment of NADH-ubiquinone oxidoreductase chain G [Burkholderiales bacterium]
MRQGPANAVLPCVLDASLPDRVVRVAAGHPASAGLGAMFGSITLERA